MKIIRLFAPLAISALLASATALAQVPATPPGNPAQARPPAGPPPPPIVNTLRAKGSQHRSYMFTPAQQEMPYRLYVPSTWDGKAQLPLILFLHGGGSDENAYLDRNDKQLEKLAEQHGYILVAPLGYTPIGSYGTPMTLRGSFGDLAGQAEDRRSCDPRTPAWKSTSARRTRSPYSIAPSPSTASIRSRSTSPVIPWVRAAAGIWPGSIPGRFVATGPSRAR